MTTEQVIQDLMAYCTRTNQTLKFAPGEVIREVTDSGRQYHTAEGLAALLSEGKERRCHEKLMKEAKRTLSGGSRLALQARVNDSETVLILAREKSTR